MVIWGLITMQHAKKETRLEREEWENDNGWESVAHGKMHREKPADPATGSNTSSALDTCAETDLEAQRMNGTGGN